MTPERAMTIANIQCKPGCLCDKCFSTTTLLLEADRDDARQTIDAVKAVAHDIAKEVAHHIETMYPAAVAACPKTFLLSVRGTVYNQIMNLREPKYKSVSEWLHDREQHRRTIKAAYRKPLICAELQEVRVAINEMLAASKVTLDLHADDEACVEDLRAAATRLRAVMGE